MRFVIANVLLFVGYLAVGLAGTWVVAATPPESPAFTLRALTETTSIPAACFVNWYLMRTSDPLRRIAGGVAAGLLACAIAFVPYYLSIFFFYLSIGGTL